MNLRPRYRIRNLLACAAVLSLFGALEASAADQPSTPSSDRAFRLFQVPPDFTMRGENADEAADHPRHVDFIVPAFGNTPPIDARPILESLGVTFREGDVAFTGKLAQTTVLFVRAAPDQIDLVETITDQTIGSGPPRHALITWRVQRMAPGAAPEVLLTRSLSCRSGQRVKFQRRLHGSEVESEEAEATLGEDGITVDINSAVKIRVGDTLLQSTGQALVRSDDPEPLLLCRTPDKLQGAPLELSISAKRITPPPDAGAGYWNSSRGVPGLPALAATVDEQVTAVLSKDASIRLSDLIWIPNLYPAPASDENSTPQGTRLKPVRIRTSAIGEDDLVDVRIELRRWGITLSDDDRAWWSPSSKLLWIKASRQAVAAAAGLSGADWWLQSGVTQLEVQFDSWQERPAREDLGSRTLLLRGGQRASSSLSAGKRKGEKLEVEGWAEGPASVADLNFALTNWRMSGETWTLNGMALTPADGTQPFPVASGMAKDNGGVMKYITVTAGRRINSWQELLGNPERKAAAIRDISSALDAANAQ